MGSPSPTAALVTMSGPMLLATTAVVSVTQTTLPHSHHPLSVNITTAMGGLSRIHALGTLSTACGTVKAALLATPAVTHQTCRGSTGHSTQPPLKTLKYGCVVINLQAMNGLEWN